MEHWREVELLAMMFVSSRWELIGSGWRVDRECERNQTWRGAVVAWFEDFGLMPTPLDIGGAWDWDEFEVELDREKAER